MGSRCQVIPERVFIRGEDLAIWLGWLDRIDLEPENQELFKRKPDQATSFSRHPPPTVALWVCATYSSSLRDRRRDLVFDEVVDATG